jgi:hypothetical protein
MISEIIANLWKPIAALLALIMGGGVLYAKGRSDAKRRVENKALTARLKTIKEVQAHARESETQDDDALVARLTRKPD